MPLRPQTEIIHSNVRANGIRFHAARVGDGPLVLFLHGFPEFWYAWKSVMPKVAKAGFTAVAVDMRGFNLSEKPSETGAYTMPTLIADVRELIRALAPNRKAILVAHDWGGAVAWAFAAAHPELLERIVIVNAPHPTVFARELASNPKQQAASAYMTFFQSPGAEKTLSANNYAGLVGSVLEARKGVGSISQVDRDAYIAAWSQPGALTGGLNYYRANKVGPPVPGNKPDGAPSLGSFGSTGPVVVRVPTLVIWGMADTALLPGNLDGLADVVHDLTVRRIVDGTHWVVHEKTELVTSLIVAFAQGRSVPQTR
jgi:pimeloyl-ACP methyl ester carboxylesterase